MTVSTFDQQSARQSTFISLAVLFTVTALILLVVMTRLSQRGRWLPKMPIEINGWTGAEKPLNRSALEQLGSPQANGFSYSNIFGENVEAHVIATSSFDAYLSPRASMVAFRFGMTAQKDVPLFGKDGAARAFVFRSPDTDARLMMYYWLQNRDGHTSTTESLQRGSDFLPRLRLGVTTAFAGTENCVVRVFTEINPADRNGIQARRNLEEVSRALHDYLKKQGGTGKAQ